MEASRIIDYINELKKYDEIIDDTKCIDILNVKIEKVSYNSKEVECKTLFVCKGDNFKIDYLNNAIDNGAIVYVSSKEYDVKIPCIIVKDVRRALSIISQMYFNYPQKRLNTIGITGTKGKSTTTCYIKEILDEYSKANLKPRTAYISTIETYDGKERKESHITTPESYELEKHFSNAAQSNIENIVMEVSSQSLSKNYARLHMINFDIGVFLNISKDHISSIEHPTFEDYFNCKLKMLEKTNTACINLDMDHVNRVKEVANKYCKKIITFSTKDSNADIFGYDIKKDGFNTIFKVKTDRFNREFKLTMPGIFNVENALAAIAVGYAMNIPERYIYIGLEKSKTIGRMEIYSSTDKKIISIVDYAHNELSFKKVFETTKYEYPERKIIVVFGCPGNKAQSRRKDLGNITGKFADYIYLTEDDPAFESVEAISKEIASYIEKYTSNYEIEVSRILAIEKAVKKITDSNDMYVLLLLGKGHENTQKEGATYIPYKSDSQVIKDLITKYNKNRAIN